MSKKPEGFTLVELVFVVGIMAFTLMSMMKLFIYTTQQGEMSGNKTLAILEAQNKMEEIRRHSYGLIVNGYAAGGTPGNIFNLSQLDGVGVVKVNGTNPELLAVEVQCFWRDKYDRIIGEDHDLDGSFETGEDNNGNGVQDSPVTLKSMVTRR